MRRLHRWLGLGLGAWFALVGLTGAIITFLPEIETWRMAAPGPGEARPLPEILAAARAARPDIPEGPLRLWPGRPLRMDFRIPSGQRVTLYLDPTSGEVLGEVGQGTKLVHLVHDLHRSLLLGRPGDVLVGLLALPTLLLLGAGFWLWREPGPLPWRERLASVRGLRGRRRLANWHRVLGLRLLPLLLIAAITGFGMAFPRTVERALYRLVPAGTPPTTASGTGPVDLAGALALAQAQRPDWAIRWIDLPQPGGPARYRIALAPTDGWPGHEAGVTVDATTGALSEIADTDPVTRISAWIEALHYGTAFGLPHRLLVLATGLGPVALGLLGFLLWRRGRGRVRRRRPDEVLSRS
ncbi:PepSY domain-containing protein [Belnapia sp. T6]|uniref:PepSY domain-containing protein n=1 Tax=Belnapia mucosa TaxID=2804532 RepID=A0ABS1V4J5_9PROT|nr:PepSY-associated TM helix domain-containing protein [Belnapia mucosa]MBL6456172.1 PepSY domain-containing protein [Belnapia mucosa]